MALTPYNKKLLEFMYKLTLHQKLMTPKEMSQKITIQGKKVSERTIKRWLKYLKDNHYFTYYPSIRYEQLDLRRALLLINNPISTRLLKIIPYKTYVMSGTDLKTAKKSFFVQYLIPSKKINDFKKFWNFAYDKRLVSDYSIFDAKQAVTIYSPIHEIVDKQGNLKFPSTIDNSFFTDLLKEKLNVEVKENLNKNIAKNPLIVPIIMEYFKEHTSSKKVWNNIKQKFGENVWGYISNIKVRKKRTDGVGISFVQKTLSYLHKNFDDFFPQIRVAYSPLYSGKKINLCLLLILRNTTCLVDLADAISKRSLYSIVYASFPEKNKIFIDILTNNDEVYNILNSILSTYVKKYINIIWVAYDESKPHWEVDTSWLKEGYYKLFNPKTLSWKFDINKYLSELKKLT